MSSQYAQPNKTASAFRSSSSRIHYSTTQDRQSMRAPDSPTKARGSGRMPPPQLHSLPRYHPANYTQPPSAPGSSNTSAVTSPDNHLVGPMSSLQSGPLSPRSPHQLSSIRQYSEAQRQLYLHQRELYNLNRGQQSPGWRSSRPVSPQLHPLGSPGPVTPLELELESEPDQSEGYFVDAFGIPHLNEIAKDAILETYMRKEAKASQKRHSGPPSRLI